MSSENRPLRYPHGSGGGEDDSDYHIGKGQKILICLIAGFAVLTTYFWFQISNELKTTDWTLDHNIDWTCSKLANYEKAMLESTKATGFPFPKQLAKNIQDKRMELGCQ